MGKDYPMFFFSHVFPMLFGPWHISPALFALLRFLSGHQEAFQGPASNHRAKDCALAAARGWSFFGSNSIKAYKNRQHPATTQGLFQPTGFMVSIPVPMFDSTISYRVNRCFLPSTGSYHARHLNLGLEKTMFKSSAGRYRCLI